MRHLSWTVRAIGAAMLATALGGCALEGLAPRPFEPAPIAMPLQAHVVHTRGMLGSAEHASTWNLAQIQRERFAGTLAGRARVVVAVLDTGADPGHPALADRLYPGLDTVGRDVMSRGRTGPVDFTGIDGNGHGTHVAGIVAQVSAGADVRIVPIKVIPHNGVGDDKLLATGIDLAIAWRDPADPSVRIRVLNLSVSSPRSSERLSAAIGRAVDAGMLVVGAAGNEGRAVEFPASLEQVLSVAATTAGGTIAGYSCFGEAVDLAAPGGSDENPVYSTWPSYLTSTDVDDGVRTPHAVAALVGTSMAAPHVTATAAVLWSARPGATARQIRATLLAMADDGGAPGPDVAFGFGRLNFARAFGANRHDAR